MSSIYEEVENLQIPLQELSDATNAFSEQNIIAKGGFGKVYRGISVRYGNIAVKMLDPGLGQGDHEFKTEISLLSVYKHKNIVSLLGFCDEDGKKILVYKYESNGSLDKHLKRKDLTWIQRLQICIDVASGLQYLHDHVEPQSRILHRDVKSSNILLDENWKARISDFGLSKMGPANMLSTHLFSQVCGTLGYIDPDYLNTGFLSQKSDVYSFGVVLFEVMCGRPSLLNKYNDNRDFLTDLVKKHWRRNTLDVIIYQDMQKQINRTSLLTFSNVAYQCLKSGNERPTMKTVVQQLQKALDNQLASIALWKDDDHGFAAHHQGKSARLMASSSQFSHPSASQSWKYDVFISFRGEDTRKTFVDHLYSALVARQIFTHKGNETILWGESIGPSLMQAIDESRIAIIVFSKGYADSSWCLNELAYVMKNRNERGQLVLPIFYDVSSSEVRSQTGPFGEGFSKHNLNNNDKVESWRDALVKASDIDGWDVSRSFNGQQWKFIKKICDDISKRLLTHSESSAEVTANIHLIGVEIRMKELKSLLKVGSGGVHMVGICGMWGSGKFTLASSIYKEISHEFEGCCFVEDVRAESRMHGLKTLQEKILSDVLKSKVILRDIEQGISMMTKRLCLNSALIVLDDVDHIDHLKMLAGSKNWFGSGSRIIFTTRNQHLVTAHSSLTHNVRMLDDREATELFSRHAFGKSYPVQGFKEVSLNMVSKFGGHPSALISLASFLHGKDQSVWISILDRLEGLPVNEILKSFKNRDDGVVRKFSNIFFQG